MMTKIWQYFTTTPVVGLFGEKETGKTSFFSRHINGTYSEEYIPTQLKELGSSSLPSNKGPVDFTLIDEPELVTGIISGAIVFVDFVKRKQWPSIIYWLDKIEENYGDIPVIVIVNKVDLCPVYINPLLHFKLSKPIKYKIFFTSVKEKLNYYEPLIYLLKQIKDDKDLEFKDAH